MRDGGLVGIIKKGLPTFHHQSVETFSTGQGVPDLNSCGEGVEFWLEAKQTKASSVDISSEQIAWAERRIRAGGKVFLAVRRLCSAGPRREAKDELHLFNAKDMRYIMLGGLNAPEAKALGIWRGGPARWDWERIKFFLLSKTPSTEAQRRNDPWRHA